MKLLLIAPYRTYSGWGEGAKHLAKSLNTLPYDLAIRPIYMSNEIDTDFNDLELLELEKKSYDHYDVVIQRVLPHVFRTIPNTKNILACVFETSNIQSNLWWNYLKKPDAIIVPSQKEKNDLLNLKVPTYNVSEAINISKYNKRHNEIKELESDKKFNFYFVGNFIERKNIKALLTAFHKEFSTSEPVNLVIKTTGNLAEVQKKIHEIKSTLRIYRSLDKYKKEILIYKRTPEDYIHDIHCNCDCLIMPSYGEAYCRPVVDALGYGNTPIVTDNTGMTDYINNNNGRIVKSTIEPVYTSQPPLSYIYTSRENWVSIDIFDLMRKMREIYQMSLSDKKKRNKMIKQGKEDVKQFSYSHIGSKIQKVIHDIAS